MRVEVGEGGWTKFEKQGVRQYRGGLRKNKGVKNPLPIMTIKQRIKNLTRSLHFLGEGSDAA